VCRRQRGRSHRGGLVYQPVPPGPVRAELRVCLPGQAARGRERRGGWACRGAGSGGGVPMGAPGGCCRPGPGRPGADPPAGACRGQAEPVPACQGAGVLPLRDVTGERWGVVRVPQQQGAWERRACAPPVPGWRVTWPRSQARAGPALMERPGGPGCWAWPQQRAGLAGLPPVPGGRAWPPAGPGPQAWQRAWPREAWERPRLRADERGWAPGWSDAPVLPVPLARRLRAWPGPWGRSGQRVLGLSAPKGWPWVRPQRGLPACHCP